MKLTRREGSAPERRATVLERHQNAIGEWISMSRFLKIRGAALALGSAAALALSAGASTPIPAAASEAVGDAGVVVISGLATLPSFPCGTPVIAPCGGGTFTGSCVASASVSLIEGED